MLSLLLVMQIAREGPSNLPQTTHKPERHVGARGAGADKEGALERCAPQHVDGCLAVNLVEPRLAHVLHAQRNGLRERHYKRGRLDRILAVVAHQLHNVRKRKLSFVYLGGVFFKKKNRKQK